MLLAPNTEVRSHWRGSHVMHRSSRTRTIQRSVDNYRFSSLSNEEETR